MKNSITTYFLFSFLLAACASHKDLQRSSTFRIIYDSKLDLFSENALKKENHEEEINIFFTQDIGGTVGTCGCSMAPFGGADRRYNFYKSISSLPNVVFFDSGGTLLPANEDLVTLHKSIGYHSHHLSALDLEQIEIRKKAPSNHPFWSLSPFVVSNYKSQEYANRFVPNRTLKLKNGLTLNVMGLEYKNPKLMKSFEYSSPQDVLNQLLNPNELNIVLNDLLISDAVKLRNSNPKTAVFLLGSANGSVKDGIKFIGTNMALIVGPGHMQQQGHLRLLWNQMSGEIRYNMGIYRLSDKFSKPDNTFTGKVNN